MGSPISQSGGCPRGGESLRQTQSKPRAQETRPLIQGCRCGRRTNPVIETGAGVPGPWCVIRDALSLILYARDHAFRRRPPQWWAFRRRPGYPEHSSLIGIRPKGTLPIALAMKKAAINVAIFTSQDAGGRISGKEKSR